MKKLKISKKILIRIIIISAVLLIGVGGYLFLALQPGRKAPLKAFKKFRHAAIARQPKTWDYLSVKSKAYFMYQARKLQRQHAAGLTTTQLFPFLPGTPASLPNLETITGKKLFLWLLNQGILQNSFKDWQISRWQAYPDFAEVELKYHGADPNCLKGEIKTFFLRKESGKYKVDLTYK
jgi:hypothetical protein